MHSRTHQLGRCRYNRRVTSEPTACAISNDTRSCFSAACHGRQVHVESGQAAVLLEAPSWSEWSARIDANLLPHSPQQRSI